MSQQFDKSSDAELFKRFAAGDEAAFYEIITRYKDSLYTFLKRFLSQHDLIEDVFQETFMQLFTSRETFDPSRPLSPWLFTIAANKAKDLLRKQQRTPAIPISGAADEQEMSFEEMLNTLTSDPTRPYEELERQETSALVRQIIAQMPENLREILIFAYFNQFSYKQIADILSIPIGTVKSRLHTAIALFAKKWKTSRREQENK